MLTLSSLLVFVLGVVSLLAVHPSTVNTIGKQLLPKTFGQSNVNIAQQVVRRLCGVFLVCFFVCKMGVLGCLGVLFVFWFLFVHFVCLGVYLFF